LYLPLPAFLMRVLSRLIRALKDVRDEPTALQRFAELDAQEA